MIECSLLFLLKDDRILLAMKKRGFGADRYNGVGGKLEPGETPEEAAVRECEEEIGVTPTGLQKVAVHKFIFPEGQPTMHVHVFTTGSWEGEPVETDEMAPEWFNAREIPYERMWQDDIVWLPLVLQGKRLTGRFDFDTNENMLSAHLELVPASVTI